MARQSDQVVNGMCPNAREFPELGVDRLWHQPASYGGP
jgi:hypothetical protein